MTLAFDTSILIEIERKNLRIIRFLKELSVSHSLPAVLPFITYYEFIRGLKLQKSKDYEIKKAFADRFNIIKTSKKTAGILADLRIKYEPKGITLPLANLLIASQAIEHNLILITSDKDFEKIEELGKIVLDSRFA